MKFWGKAFILIMGVSLGLVACESDDSKSIVVVYENDVLCSAEGFAKFAGLRDAVADTAYVLTVSSGDFLQGGALGSVSKGGYRFLKRSVNLCEFYPEKIPFHLTLSPL